MLNYEKLEDSVKNILKERAPIYKLAMIRIEASEMNKKKAANEIRKYL
jgi:shikimate kinase